MLLTSSADNSNSQASIASSILLIEFRPKIGALMNGLDCTYAMAITALETPLAFAISSIFSLISLSALVMGRVRKPMATGLQDGIIKVLHRDKLSPAMHARRILVLQQLVSTHGGSPNVANLARLDDIMESFHCLLDWGVWVEAMDLKQIDVVEVQSL
ncbi:hypothetical protein KCU77_g10, partial [Aureobasidium melanogenum]